MKSFNIEDILGAHVQPKRAKQSDVINLKRTRHCFSSHQLKQLENLFLRTNYPDTVTRKTLAFSMNVSEIRIQIWFQNRRAKQRRKKKVSTEWEADNAITYNNPIPDITDAIPFFAKAVRQTHSWNQYLKNSINHKKLAGCIPIDSCYDYKISKYCERKTKLQSHKYGESINLTDTNFKTFFSEYEHTFDQRPRDSISVSPNHLQQSLENRSRDSLSGSPTHSPSKRP